MPCLRPLSGLLSDAGNECMARALYSMKPSASAPALLPPLKKGSGTVAHRLTFSNEPLVSTPAVAPKEKRASLSMAVCRANDEVRQLSTDLENLVTSGFCRQRTASQGQIPAVAWDAGDYEAQAESFRKGAADLNLMLEALAKAARLEHLSEENSKELRLKAEREEERLRKEAEERRARMRERQARDPKKKVALKLETQRRFGRAESAGIPMRKLEIIGAHGPEHMMLVDVTCIQRNCEGLDLGASVTSILENRSRRGKKGKPRAVSMGSALGPLGATCPPGMGQGGHLQGLPEVPRAMTAG